MNQAKAQNNPPNNIIADNIPHVFISYARKDIDFVGKIVQALAENNLETWIDWKSIPKGEDWEKEIYQGIETADAFLFVISPASVESEMCNREISHAVKNGKRVIPIFIANVDDREIYGVTEKIIHTRPKEEINKRNFIFCREKMDDFERAVKEIEKTIHTDYAWLTFHKDLQVKALKWQKKRKNNSHLIRGKELREINQKTKSVKKDADPQLTNLQKQFILACVRHSRMMTMMWSVIAIALLYSFQIFMDHVPEKVNVDGQIFEIRNDSGYIFLQVDVGSTISAYSIPQKLTSKSDYVIIIGTNADGEQPGSILAYNMRGRLQWKSNGFAGGTDSNIKNLLVESIMGNGEYQIVFSDHNSTFWHNPSINILNVEGELTNQYIDGGFINDILPQDLNGDGIKELIVSANTRHGLIRFDDPLVYPVIMYVISPSPGPDQRIFNVYPELLFGTEHKNWIAVFDPSFVEHISFRVVEEGDETLIEIFHDPQGWYILIDQYGVIRQVAISDRWRLEYGDRSPKEFVCFLSYKKEGVILEQADREDPCPFLSR